MTFNPDRPAHLRPVPPPTERHLAAIARAGDPTRLLRAIQASQEAALSAVERDALARGIIAALPADQKPGQAIHTVTCDDNGVWVTNCVRCGTQHYTLWERVVIDTAITWDGDRKYVANWDCPFSRLPLAQILTPHEFDAAVQSGAEPPEDDEEEEPDHDAQVLRFRDWLDHPSSLPGSRGWNRPGGGDAA